MKNLVSTGIALAAGLVLFAAFAAPVRAQCAAPKNVSGRWTANDGGTYHLHAIGSAIWWVGVSSDDGRSWTNVFKGTRNGNNIEGEWADVRGSAWGHGTLTLRISGTTFMEKTGGTGSGFGGKRWGRGGCNDTQGGPAGQ
ncbi:MAG: hypothetical protein ABI178_02125 [Rhodanobacter sp.]